MPQFGFMMASRQGWTDMGFPVSVPLSIAGGQESRLFQTHGIRLLFSPKLNNQNLASRGFDTCSYSITRMTIPI